MFRWCIRGTDDIRQAVRAAARRMIPGCRRWRDGTPTRSLTLLCISSSPALRESLHLGAIGSDQHDFHKPFKSAETLEAFPPDWRSGPPKLVMSASAVLSGKDGVPAVLL